MRLVCPNCNAQYEVDAAVIPDEGRDVLCSNCGHAWFQMSERQLAAAAADEQAETPLAEATAAADAAAEAVAEIIAEESPAASVGDAAEVAEAAAAEAAATTAASVQAAAEDAVAARAAAGLGSEGLGPEDFAREPAAREAGADGAGAGATDASEADAAASPAPRRALDDEMLSVLREEAARESEARRAEGSAIEMQPELGLPEAEAPQPTIESIGAATVRAQRRRDEELAEEAEAGETDIGQGGAGPEAPAPVNRKALLPDIEEINSTLTASSERRDLPSTLDEIDRRRSRSGFRAGFSVSLLIAVALLLLYVSAPRLSQGLPALAPALERYVASVDAGRIWLDARLRNPGATGSN